MNAVEFDAVLKVDSFNFGYALEIDPKFIELEYPFYWADVYELTHEFYDLWLHGCCVFQDENRHAATPGRHQCGRRPPG